MKAIILLIISIIQSVILIVGILISIIKAGTGFSNEDEVSKKKALKYFLITMLATFILGLLELLITFYVHY